MLGIESQQAENDLLEALCGCTGKEITKEQSLKMYPSQKYTYTEGRGWKLKKEYRKPWYIALKNKILLKYTLTSISYYQKWGCKKKHKKLIKYEDFWYCPYCRKTVEK